MDLSNPHQLFATLGLLPTATEKEVKTAYRKLALLHHPDKGTDRDPDKIKAINVAYSEIMSQELYRPPRTGSSGDEYEPWYEFTQPWRPTPEEFKQFNEECVAAYVERYDDEIRSFVPEFDQMEENQREKSRSRYRCWLNGGKKKPFEPEPLEASPEKPAFTTPVKEYAVFTVRKPARNYRSTSDLFLAHLEALFIILMAILLTSIICLNIVTPQSLGGWFLVCVIITMCAPMGWTDQIAR